MCSSVIVVWLCSGRYLPLVADENCRLIETQQAVPHTAPEMWANEFHARRNEMHVSHMPHETEAELERAFEQAKRTLPSVVTRRSISSETNVKLQIKQRGKPNLQKQMMQLTGPTNSQMRTRNRGSMSSPSNKASLSTRPTLRKHWLGPLVCC